MSLLSLLISSCAITPPDVPLCTEINPDKGFCVNTISSTEFEVDDVHLLEDKSWWELRPLMIYMPAQSWAKIKAFIINICKKSGQCNNKHISNWQRTVNTIDKKIAQ